MPTLDFDSLRVNTTFNGYSAGPTGNITPVFTDHEFGRFTISGNRSGTNDRSESSFTYAKVGTVDFASFPRVPAAAQITKVEVRIPSSSLFNISTTCSASELNETYATDLDPNFYGVGAPVPLSLNSAVCPARATQVSYSFSKSGSVADVVHDYSTSPISYSDLVTLFGTQTLWMSGFIGAMSVAGGNNVDFTMNYDLGWRIRVTYTEGPYSWYIKPTKKIVNGQSIDIIADPATDIEAIQDGDSVPDGFQFYATGVDLPSLIFYWWSSPDFYQFFIFSQISPGPTWVNLGTSPPACTNCLSLTLEGLSVLVADASGIYTLVTNKRNDTLYVRTDPANVITIDYKMPNPIAKIGFVP